MSRTVFNLNGGFLPGVHCFKIEIRDTDGHAECYKPAEVRINFYDKPYNVGTSVGVVKSVYSCKLHQEDAK